METWLTCCTRDANMELVSPLAQWEPISSDHKFCIPRTLYSLHTRHKLVCWCYPTPPALSPHVAGQGEWHSHDFIPEFFKCHKHIPDTLFSRQAGQDESGPTPGAVITSYLTDTPQYIRLKDTVANTLVNSTGAPQWTMPLCSSLVESW